MVRWIKSQCYKWQMKRLELQEIGKLIRELARSRELIETNAERATLDKGIVVSG